MLLFLSSLLIVYVAFLAACMYAWHNKVADTIVHGVQVQLTVVVCARNEERAIAQILQDILAQSYSAAEIIVVDDGSTDATAEIVRSFSEVSLISTKGVGKKRALQQAIQRASHDFIVCTDADCHVTSDWLATIATCFHNYHPSLIIAPVKMDGCGMWEKLQSIEFLSLVSVTAGAAALHHPVMCNGANLAFKRNVWLSSFNQMHTEEQSGDDMFFLINCKRNNYPVYYLKSQQALAHIKPFEGVSPFIRQRIRWTSKSKAYSDIEIILLAVVTWSISLTPIFLLFFNWHIAWLIWGLKTIADVCFTKYFATFFQVKFSVWSALALAVVYPFYIGVVTLSSLFVNVKWK